MRTSRLPASPKKARNVHSRGLVFRDSYMRFENNLVIFDEPTAHWKPLNLKNH
jgi:hypothetical protein